VTGTRAAAGSLAGAIVATMAFAAFAAPPASAATPAPPPAQGRVLIISLPDTEWVDFEQAATPNLDRLFSQSAVGSMGMALFYAAQRWVS